MELIAAAMRNVPWSAQAVYFTDGMVYVNARADRNVQPGMVLGVYRMAQAELHFIDSVRR